MSKKIKAEVAAAEADLTAELKKGKAPSIASIMIQIAEERFTLGRDQLNHLFGVDSLGGNVAMPFEGPKGVMARLGALVYQQTGRTPSNNANSEVKKLLQHRAASTEAVNLPIRTGRIGSEALITIDGGDETGSAIEVRPGKWEVVSRSKLPFRRTNCTSPLVEPRRSGGASGMRPLFNVSDAEWEFLFNWQVIALVPGIPHVMPILEGNPGSAKTSTTKMLVGAVDPSKAALNSPPKSQEALEISAYGSWVFALENISTVSAEISDGLARLITGAGARKRELYTDGDIHIQEMQRVVVLNGISISGLRADVLDRAVTIRLNPPSRTERKTDEEVLKAYEAALPAHLAQMLDCLSAGLKLEASGSRIDSSGRMASFEQWLAWCDEIRGTETLKWYRAQQRADVISHVTEDEVVMGIYSRSAETGGKPVQGTAMQILRDLKAYGLLDEKSRAVPRTAKAMTSHLRLVTAGLLEAGWKVEERVYEGSKNAARWFFAPPPVG